MGWMTKAQVAEMIEVHPRTVDRYVNAGKLTAYRRTDGTRFRTEDLEGFQVPAEDTTAEWLDKATAAAYLKVNPRTLDRYAAEGKIIKYKLRGTQAVRFKRSELDPLNVPVPVGCCTPDAIPAAGAHLDRDEPRMGAGLSGVLDTPAGGALLDPFRIAQN